jgi:hypothetical protein
VEHWEGEPFMKKKLSFSRASFLGAAAIVATGMAFSTAVQADTRQFTLADCNSNACSPQLGNDFGTVTISDIAAGVVVPVAVPVPASLAVTGLAGIVVACGGLLALSRRRRRLA